MAYNFKRALGIAFALYAATFIVGIVAGIVSGQDMSSLSDIPDSFWYVGMVSAVILTVVCALWYFRNSIITPSIKSGLLFGLTTAVLSFVLDFLLFSIGNTQGANVDLMEYYGDFRFWIIVLLVLISAVLVGHLKRPKTS